MKFIDAFSSNTGYVAHKWSHYLFIYDELLLPYIKNNKPVNLLEIGVQNGGSLQIWKKYLPAGSQIYGVDINEKCKTLNFPENVHFLCGDATDKKFLDREFKDIKFDVILDDGSHINKDVIKTFNTLFVNKLNDGGVYIVEDMHTSYWKGFGGGFRKRDTMIEFFKRLVDALTVPHIKKRPLFFSKKQYYALKEMNKYIKRISFYDSVCAIEKFGKVKYIDNFSLISGDKAEICDDVFLAPNICNPEAAQKTEQIRQAYENS